MGFFHKKLYFFQKQKAVNWKL